MSRSGGVKVSKTGLIIGLLLALAICVGWIGYGLSKSAEYERQADNKRAEYSEYTRRKISEACVGIPKVEAVKCRYDAFDARRAYNYNQTDLIAQRQSALWAYIMGAAAVIGIALSAVGVWLVKTTFDETRRSNEIAEAAAKSFAREAEINRKALIQAERAIIDSIFICQKPGPLESPNNILLEISVKNAGRSNASYFGIFFRVAKEPLFSAKWEHSHRFDRICRADSVRHLPDITIRKPKQYPSYVIGMVEYRTFHEATFRTFFCRRIDEWHRDSYGDVVNKDLTVVPCQKMPPDT